MTKRRELRRNSVDYEFNDSNQSYDGDMSSENINRPIYFKSEENCSNDRDRKHYSANLQKGPCFLLLRS